MEIDKPIWINDGKLLGDTPRNENSADGPLGLLVRARNISTGLERISLERYIETPASTMVLVLEPVSDPNNSAVKSAAVRLPFPVQIGEVQGSCVAAGGTAAVADVLVGEDVSTTASILEAPIDIKTGLDEPESARPEVDKDVVPAGSVIQIEITGTGAGAVTGATVVVFCKRV